MASIAGLRRARIQRGQESAQRRLSRLPGPTTLAEFETLAGTTGSGTRRSPTVPFRGGRLSQRDFEAASFLESQELIAEFKQQEEAAKAANLERFGQVVGGFEQLKADIGTGEQARADIGETFRRAEARGQSALVRSGLSSTTIAPTVSVRTGVEEASALGRLNETIRREKVGIETQRLGGIERREDTGPSQSLFVQLQQQLGNVA